MRRIELELEHRYKNKFVGRHRLTSHSGLTVIGSSQTADIRLLGDDVSLIHAYLEADANGWRLIDAGSEHGTWVAKKPITSETLEGDETVAVIGKHELRIRPRKLDFELFGKEDLNQDTATGTTPHHQVILRKNGHIVRTLLLPETEAYLFPYGEKDHEFPAPMAGEFKDNQVGDFQVQQRRVLTGPVEKPEQNMLEKLTGPEARAAFLSLVALLFLGGLLALTTHNSEEAELTPPKVEENRFTKMIYDAELIKKKRNEARKKQKVFMARRSSAQGTPKPDNKPVTTKVRSQGSTPKVVSKLKMTGLQNMLGKIAKRATNNGPKIAGYGRNPASATGRAQPASASGSLAGIKTKAGNGGTKFRVGGVGTVGKGGGGSTKGMGGLALGGVGSASVGIVDDETEVQGGLDKDEIARVINSQLGEIRYCYERQLAAKPDMYGKVVIGFAIDGSGSVSTQRIKRSTLNSAMVEGCILRRVASWQFPQPKGGTTVLVTYPFLFKSTN